MSPRVLIACEYSGVVRDAFRAKGIDAVSCDLLPTERPGPHIQGDVLKVLGDGWDLMIAHPPCTHLSVSGARWFEEKRRDGRQQQAIDFFMEFVNAPIPMICIENPVGIMSGLYRKPDQIIQPYHFGDPFEKRTCLWLKNLPLLVATKIVTPPPRVKFKGGTTMPAWYNLSPGPERGKIRSATFPGTAQAMAEQWAPLLLESQIGTAQKDYRHSTQSRLDFTPKRGTMGYRLPKPENIGARQSGRTLSQVECPLCRKYVFDLENHNCPGAADTPFTTRSSIPGMGGYMPCPVCNYRNVEGSYTCAECGEPLPQKVYGRKPSLGASPAIGATSSSRGRVAFPPPRRPAPPPSMAALPPPRRPPLALPPPRPSVGDVRALHGRFAAAKTIDEADEVWDEIRRAAIEGEISDQDYLDLLSERRASSRSTPSHTSGVGSLYLTGPGDKLGRKKGSTKMAAKKTSKKKTSPKKKSAKKKKSVAKKKPAAKRKPAKRPAAKKKPAKRSSPKKKPAAKRKPAKKRSSPKKKTAKRKPAKKKSSPKKRPSVSGKSAKKKSSKKKAPRRASSSAPKVSFVGLGSGTEVGCVISWGKKKALIKMSKVKGKNPKKSSVLAYYAAHPERFSIRHS